MGQFQLCQIVLRGRIPAPMLRSLLQADCVAVGGMKGAGCTLLPLASESSPALVAVSLDADADLNLPWDKTAHWPLDISYLLHHASWGWHDSAALGGWLVHSAHSRDQYQRQRMRDP